MPSKVFVLLAMLFCHVLDDFVLQSAFLAKGKQRDWWKQEAPDPKYKYDYIMCLFMHSASWAFMIMLPIAWYYNFEVGVSFVITYFINLVVHMYIDDRKANKHKINLIQDQIYHIVWIVSTYLGFVLT